MLDQFFFQMEIRGNLETIKIVFNNLTTIIEEDDVLSKVDFGNRAKGTSTLKKVVNLYFKLYLFNE